MENLPTELIAEILSYLTWSELKTARLVCNFWYKLSLNLISKKCGINLNDVKNVCSDEYQNWLILNKIAFHTVSIRPNFDAESLEPEEFKKLLNIFHPKTKQITLGNNYLSVEQFKFVVERCPNLECLGLLTGAFGETFLEPEHIAELIQLKPLANLSKFQFQSGVNGFQNGNVFQLLTNAMPNVEHVEVQISSWKRVDENRLAECEQVLQNFIKKQATKLKVLKFSGWDFSVLENCIMASSLNLAGLDIDIRATLTGDLHFGRRIIAVLLTKTKLEHLRLARFHLDSEMLQNLASNLKSLKMFHMDDCNLENCSLHVLEKLENLEKLELNSNFIHTVYDDVTKAFLFKENYKLKSLTMSGTLGKHESFYDRLHNFKNLTQLHLNSLDFLINDNCFQQIIYNLKKLKLLKIWGTGKITDAAVFNECDANRCISSLSRLEIFLLTMTNSSSCKFSDMAVYEFLKLKHLKSLVLPESEMISELCHKKLTDSVSSYKRVRRNVHIELTRGPGFLRRFDID